MKSRTLTSYSRGEPEPKDRGTSARTSPPALRLWAAQRYAVAIDGAARHTKEGYAFQALAMREGFKEAVRQRDEPFGDFGR